MAKAKKSPHKKRHSSAAHTKKENTHKSITIDESSLLEAESGIVISRFGQQVDVADQDFTIIRCFIRKSMQVPVVGDRAIFRRQKNLDTGVLVDLEERHSLLKRPTPHHGIKPVVANIDFIGLLLAPELGFSEMMLDRYLVAAEASQLAVWIIFNKWDLLSESEQQVINERLNVYEKLNYPIYRISAKQGIGVTPLLKDIQGKQLLLAGQSGVGKSTLIQYLFPDLEVTTSAISQTSGLGTHTTTASRLYKLNQETYLIDSPGVREFGLWHLEPEDIRQGFIEIATTGEQCKFRDCKHLNEPGCAVLAAHKNQEIAHTRLKNYHHLIQHFDQIFT